MADWPGPLQSVRGAALSALGWVAQALLLALVVVVGALLLSQLVGAFKPLLRLPPEPIVAVCFVAVVVLWLVGLERAKGALLGGAVFLGVLAVTAVIVGILAWRLGHHLAGRTDPVTTLGLWVGFGVGSLITLVSLTAATFLAWKAYTGAVNIWFVALAVLTLMAIAGGYLTVRDPRWRLDPDGQQIKARGLGRVDVLVVVDPRDPAGRALIAEANENGDVLRRPPQDTVRFDIAFGLAVPDGTVHSPGSRGSFISALAGVAPAEGQPAHRSYGRTLLDAVNSSGMNWRESSRRAVVFVTARAPREDELPDFARALAAAQPDVAVYMVAPPGDPAAGTWRTWTEATGGRLIDTSAYDRQASLQAIEDALTDSPVKSARDLAQLYRPYLNLAIGELTRPVDVDALLLDRKRQKAESMVCDRHRFRGDDCVTFSKPLGLLRGPDGRLREQDEYIDFEEDVREAFHGKGPRVGRRMYFHMRRHDGLLHIGYWWFLPVNISPIQVNETCLPGLTLSELTCYDHEGDWEGVTVTLQPRSVEFTPSGDPYNPAAFDPKAWRPRSVTYDAHGRGIRWLWKRLRETPAVADSTHPVVFAARGSHASYPLPCAAHCDQRLARRALPEGPFNGSADTRFACDDECLMPLPSLRRQRPFTRPFERVEDPVLWNAFPGRWGAAVCLPVAQVCSQSDGPRTPSRQDRYMRPWRTLQPDAKAIRRFESIVAGGARG